TRPLLIRRRRRGRGLGRMGRVGQTQSLHGGRTMLSREMDPRCGRSGRSFLQLEGLEVRDCPSSAVLQGHTLLLTGDASNSTMTIRDGGHGNVTATVVDGKGHRTTV